MAKIKAEDSIKKKKGNKRYKILNVVSILMFLIIWQIFSTMNETAQWMNPKFLPGPIRIIQTAGEYFQKGTLFTHILASLRRVMIGFLGGTLLAVVVGYICCSNKVISNIVDPVFNFIGPIPAYAFMPLFVIWFGIGELPKYIMIGYVTFFPMLSYTREGINNIDPALIRMAMSLGASSWQIFHKITIKAALPTVIAGMKTSLALIFSGLVVAEMMGSATGLGYIIVDSKNYFRVSDMFMSMFLIAALYLLIYFFINFIESRLFKWKKTGIGAAVDN